MTVGGLKNLFEAIYELAQEPGKCGPPMVDQGLRHGPNNTVRHDARSRDLKKRAARHEMRERYRIFAKDVKPILLAASGLAVRQARL